MTIEHLKPTRRGYLGGWTACTSKGQPARASARGHIQSLDGDRSPGTLYHIQRTRHGANMAANELSEKQKRFAIEMLRLGNATQAAIAAGYAANSAHVTGHRLLRNDKVREILDGRLEEAAERAEVTTDMVIQGLLSEARFRGKGSSQGARVAAWAHLGKYRGMFVDRVDLNVEPSAIEFIVAEPGDTELEVRDVPYLRIEDSGSNGSEDEGAA